MAITTILNTDSGASSLTQINANFVDLDTTKADLASPTFTGEPKAPTPSANDNSTKLATTAYVDAANSTIVMETTAGATHSLVTTAGQVVWVVAKGTWINSTAPATITLAYNGVAKDTVIINDASAGTKYPFCLQYTETPGAGTQNVTVTTSGAGNTLSEVVIVVQKIS